MDEEDLKELSEEAKVVLKVYEEVAVRYIYNNQQSNNRVAANYAQRMYALEEVGHRLGLSQELFDDIVEINDVKWSEGINSDGQLVYINIDN